MITRLLALLRLLHGALQRMWTARREEPKRIPEERPGPYRQEPIVDLEFTDRDGNVLGDASAHLVVRIASSGLLIEPLIPIVMRAQCSGILHAWSIWIGDQRLTTQIPNDVPVAKGDGYHLDLAFPLVLDGDIYWRKPPPPKSPDPVPGTQHVRQHSNG